MAKKFSCGRLVLQKDGTIKKVVLVGGGGARDCFISHIDMGFDEIHDRLREIFLPNQPNCPSKLYDFQCQELDTNRYRTFYDYIKQNGLKFKGILVYLYTAEDPDDTMIPRSSEKRRTTITTPPTTTQLVQRPGPIIRIPQVEADSSTPPVAIKIDDDLPSTTLNIPKCSFSTYSFENSLNEFINYLRKLITRYNHENILIQLLEYISTIHGISSIILDRLKRHIQSTNDYQNSIYNDGLEKIEKISRTINALIELNKMKISNIDQNSIIINSFNQFQQNFHILRDQWINNRNNSRHNTVDPEPTTSFSSQKRTHSSRRSNQEDNTEKYSIFKNLLKSLDHLLEILRQRGFKSFYIMIESLIRDIENCRSNLKLSDNRSLYDAEKLIISIENRLRNRINDEYHHASSHGINRNLEYAFNKTLNAIPQLLTSFQHYQSQIKRLRTTHTEEKPTINKSIQSSKTRIDDDQSSDESHSSIGDEILMEVARDAYEQRPNRFQ